MRHAVGDVEKEWPVFVLLDEFDCVLCIPCRQLTLIGVVLNHFVAFNQGQFREFLTRMVWPHVIGIRQSEIFVEPVVKGQELPMMSEMPLSIDSGSITASFEDVCNG